MRSELIIHLDKLDQNLAAVRSKIQPNTKVMAVVKDNAYGHGAERVALHLEKNVEWFCIARIEEGIELRKAGITKPVLVFEIPRVEDVSLYPEYNLTATVADISTLDILEPGTEYHINFDTGMRRIGVPDYDTQEVISRYHSDSHLKCTGIYTHFATSDVPDSDNVINQKKLFDEIASHFPKSIFKHAANTGAIFYYDDRNVQYDAVRAGVCLYGYAPGDRTIKELTPIIEWKSYINQIRRVKKGAPVGYGQSWVAPDDGFIATVPVGYGDGLNRGLSNKMKVRVGEKFYEQAGRISMEFMSFYSPEDDLQSGMEVYLLDTNKLHPKKWASTLQTIPYEITTDIKPDIKRVYIR